MEELDIRAMLDKFKSGGFEKGEQVILGHFGTVQTLLSIIFGEPVDVHLVTQESQKGVIHRLVHLMAGRLIVAVANSLIPLECNDHGTIITDVINGHLGLGQIVMQYQVSTRRVLIDLGRERHTFWRTYTILGRGVHFEITEHFQRETFEAVGWLKPWEV